MTYGELRRGVALFAAAMRKMGVQTGDRVVGELRISSSQRVEKHLIFASPR